MAPPSIMSPAEIRTRIASFPRWHYEFDLQGERTPILDPRFVNRHRQRKRYFFDPLVRLMGGSLQGRRVLDLGCNAGFWSLAAVQAGCDFVLGIDGRRLHVDQAHFVFEVQGVDPARFAFRQANVYDLGGLDVGSFDIVFLLGLMYHICKPMELLEILAAMNTDVLLIDTLISTLPGSLLEIRHEDTDEPRHAVDYGLVTVPTRQAVEEMVAQFDYRCATLAPAFTDYTGSEDYRNGSRRAFLCARHTCLDGLEVEPQAAGRPRDQGGRWRRWFFRGAGGPT